MEERGEGDAPYPTPDNAHQDLLAQDRVQEDSVGLDAEPPQQLPPQPVQSSEMVAASVYPIPPAAMVPASVPANVPANVPTDVAPPTLDATGAGIPGDQYVNIDQDRQISEHALPTPDSKDSVASLSKSTTEDTISPLQKQTPPLCYSNSSLPGEESEGSKEAQCSSSH